jgi:RNA polymerase sigma-70 factor (sigma-E family)
MGDERRGLRDVSDRCNHSLIRGLSYLGSTRDLVDIVEPPEFRDWATAARPRLRRTAYLLSGDWHLAEDLAQETLLRMYAVWRRVAQIGAPDAYARRTLINAYRSTLRRPSRREYLTDVIPEQAAAQSGSPEERDVLLRALAELGQSQRAIVVLRYWEDLSVIEVAEVLGLSQGTVKSQASRALATLRGRLSDLTTTAGMESDS